MDATDSAPDTRRHLTVRCQFCQAWNRVDAARVADRPKCGKCAKPVLLDRPLKLDDETFDRTLAETDVPVLVDFYADWCGPCKMMAPSVDRLASEYAGRALVTKLDTDHAQRTTRKFDIRSIPTVMVFQRGQDVARHSWLVPYPELEQLLVRALGPDGGR